MWIETKVLKEIKELPSTLQGISKRALKENWIRRRKPNAKGNVYEYALTSLPESVQAAILIKTAKKAEPREPKVVEQERYLAQAVWANWEKSTTKQQDTAKKRLECVQAVAGLVENGTGIKDALVLVATQTDEKVGSIKNWYYQAIKFERTDWLPVLLPRYSQRKSRTAEFTPQAWEFFKADYFRPERPEFGSCYERLQQAAAENGWQIPSLSSVKRKVERDVDKKLQVLWREGERALSDMYPAQIRTIEDIEAMEWINGDGYQHNVFVEWVNGEVVRPKTWLWQDIRTRKILAYRTDVSENSDTIRLSLMDVVNRYGIPKKLTIDNTRAAANKWMTGGVKNRYRFKVKEDDPMGIIPLLGIQLYWTSVQFGKGHGQAKPIERAFSHGGLGELVDKHPRLAGFYAGANIYDKPDNYNGGKAGAKYEDFILALEDGIQAFNNRLKRRTELCQGIYSFEQVFQRDYAKAHVKKATAEQLRYMMLMSEAVTLKANGTFELSCGGKVNNRKNRYEAIDLIGSKHKKVVVKFDPQDLHGTVFVYDLQGQFLAEAECTEKAAFGGKAEARVHSKYKNQFVKATKVAAKAQHQMTMAEMQNLMPEVEIEDEMETPSIMEMHFQEGSALKKTYIELDDDEESDFQKGFARAVEMDIAKKLNR